MRYPPIIRTFGIVFIIFSSLGILFSLTGIASLWILKPRFKDGLLDLISSMDETFETTEKVLLILEDVLENTKTNVDLIETAFIDLDNTIKSTSTSLEFSAELVGDDLRLTILETQSALFSAASSAKLIDNTLSFLASIPLLGADYRPDVPLNISLENAAGSLQDIPESLEDIEQSLSNTADGLNSFNANLSELSRNLQELKKDLQDGQDVLVEYKELLDSEKDRSAKLRSNLSLILTLITIYLSGVLFWLGFAQVHILMQGLTYYKGEQYVVNLADIQRE